MMSTAQYIGSLLGLILGTLAALVLLTVHTGCVMIKPTGDLIYKPAVVAQGDGRDYLVEQDNDGAKVDVSGGKLK